ncbi:MULTISPECIES: hypothetical protein [unclassified Methanoculleus]|jgi:hypothetical protein|uniref:Uncharacterized protein n=1 Tax=Methanoculleus palmolei TaxID=72612 RepID=A0ABD8AAK3_9EURY|nr:hypothetical protein [Methanoculleus sp. UBA377]MDD2472615.1 hypothetical protein [Methanoculleus sp.]WOX56569.1 hypothetical protein R6Y95_04340 [Methanoculleus palmolei]
MADYRIVACIPALAVLFDYSMTFIFSGGRDELLRLEFSPLVRYAVANDIVIVYLLFMMLFYYVVAFAALRLLRPTGLYGFGVVLLLLVAATHVLGGFSWVVRSAVYSLAVHGVSIAAVVVALAAFGYAVLQRPEKQ